MISVIMTIYNEPWKWVQKAIVSLGQQTYKNFEVIIIIDNPNYLDTPRLKELLISLHINSVVRVNKQNIGLVSSLNSALSFVQGQYVARFDSDDECLPDRFERELEFLKGHNYDFVASAINIMSEHGSIVKSLAFKGFLSNKEVKWIEPRSNPFWHPTWLMRKKVMDELKGYRNLYSVEDFDFVLRAIVSDFKLGIIGQPLLNKRIVKTSISETGSFKQAVYAHFLIDKFKQGKLNEPFKLPVINSEDEAKYLTTLERKNNLENASYLRKLGFALSLFQTASGRMILRNIINQRFSIPTAKMLKYLLF